MQRGGSERRLDTIAVNKLIRAAARAVPRRAAPRRVASCRADSASGARSEWPRHVTKQHRPGPPGYLMIYNVNLGKELIDCCVSF